MPEGDAVWRTARRLHTALAGELVEGSDLRVPALATADLSGRRTLEVVPRGKHLLHRMEDDLTLHSHLRMEGSWRVHPVGRRRALGARHTVRALVWTGARVAVGDSLGMLDLVRTSEEHRVVGHLGPDLLDPGYDAALALRNVLADPARTVTEALLDQRNVAGMGTIFTAEPLFVHGINPWTPVGEVGAEVVAEVLSTARHLLVLSCRTGRTTVTGRADVNADDAWVHGRMGLPCKRCGTTVRLAPIGQQPRERVMFYCPTCQGGRAPGDDGARQTPLGHGRSRYA
ncbi:DNA-formamidopyrimidine glycosylase family protein [Ornithinimicrobium pekingense]|uniref:DNA-(apurinic or apyrimidinic site) lyase n=1 Tax=Ornithinimicrobium pekingense TaxID=384677 RepID=A0ABQ2F5P7_9MICO|nr:DNA-formamidopyrimidine glycosylase family protein [Ornithinimicrobium pekingense]GGK64566.1 putative endonuclease 8 2 [Ornithinimicrobium pekingense]